jgi:hypothetical protein
VTFAVDGLRVRDGSVRVAGAVVEATPQPGRKGGTTPRCRASGSR